MANQATVSLSRQDSVVCLQKTSSSEELCSSGADASSVACNVRDRARLNIAEWQDRQDESILYVPKAGEIPNRLKT